MAAWQGHCGVLCAGLACMRLINSRLLGPLVVFRSGFVCPSFDVHAPCITPVGGLPSDPPLEVCRHNLQPPTHLVLAEHQH